MLTGPNMGGKTVALLLAGALQYLAQLGYPVPASRTEFAWVDRVDFIGGELGSVVEGLSSFGGEMEALAEVLSAPGRALLLLDEIGRGTNPVEGQALASALVDWLTEREHLALLATHYPAVGRECGVSRYRVVGLGGVDDEALTAAVRRDGWRASLGRFMDYRIVADETGSPPRDAIRVASLFGLPANLLARARSVALGGAGDEGDR